MVDLRAICRPGLKRTRAGTSPATEDEGIDVHVPVAMEPACPVRDDKGPALENPIAFLSSPCVHVSCPSNDGGKGVHLRICIFKGIISTWMSTNQQMRPVDFFARHSVFRHDEFVMAHAGSGHRSPQTSAAVLKQHVASGRLLHVRRGLYATVLPDVSPERLQVDPYLLAVKLSNDAVVAYHAALQFHGKACSVWRCFHYLSRARQRSFEFHGLEFVPVQPPPSLRSLPDFGGYIKEHSHAGERIRVTTLERTLVDVLDAPGRCGGWEEIWRSLEHVEFFDLSIVIDYVEKLGSALTAARVGFYLDQHRERLMVEDDHLRALHVLAPRQPRYFDTQRRPGKWVPAWNLVVPEQILSRTWAQVDGC